MKKFALEFIGISSLFSFVLTGIFSPARAPKERYVEFDYDVHLDQIPQDTRDINIWLPLMPENDYQKIEKITIEPNSNYRITFDKTYDNKILHYALRSPQVPFHIRVHYKVQRIEYSNRSQEKRPIPIGVISEDPWESSKYLAPNRLMTISPRIRELAAQVTKGRKGTLEKTRAIYDYV
ncbi:MAG: transglutaminase family protein, partial [Candidatus Omnitrophica bacterium]|nr:transglutaminase family protein [Candidatus Omnitrophota bacterium]